MMFSYESGLLTLLRNIILDNMELMALMPIFSRAQEKQSPIILLSLFTISFFPYKINGDFEGMWYGEQKRVYLKLYPWTKLWIL